MPNNNPTLDEQRAAIFNSLSPDDPARREPEKFSVRRHTEAPSSLEGFASGLDLTPPTPEEEEARREASRRNIQETLDAINLEAGRIRQQAQQRGTEREERTRSIVATAGLRGSPRGEAVRREAEDITDENLRLIEKERTAKIQEALGRADAAARAEIEAERARVSQDQEKFFGILQGLRNETRNDVRELGKSGVTLDQLPQELKDSYLSRGGFSSETELELFLNANRPSESQIDYKTTIFGGKLLGLGIDPVTGQVKTFEQDLPEGFADAFGTEQGQNFKHTFAPDGTLLLIPETLDPTKPNAGIIIGGDFAKPENPLDRAYKQAQIDKIRADIARGSGGNDDLVSTILDNPELFNQLTPSEKAKVAPRLHDLGFTAFGKPLSDVALKEITQTETAISQLEDLKDTIQENIQYIGPVSGLQRLNPYSEARQVQATLDLVKQNVGKALEGGVLRKEDEEKYKKILAQLTDTPDTAIYKTEQLIENLKRNVETYKGNQLLAGRNVDQLNEGDQGSDLETLAEQNGYDPAEVQELRDSGYNDKQIEQIITQ